MLNGLFYVLIDYIDIIRIVIDIFGNFGGLEIIFGEYKFIMFRLY